MNSNIKQGVSKISNICGAQEYVLITSDRVIFKESVYERKEDSSWTESQLNIEEVQEKVGLIKSRHNLDFFCLLLFILNLNSVKQKETNIRDLKPKFYNLKMKIIVCIGFFFRVL